MIVGLTACSDGQLKEWKQQNNELCRIMEGMGIETVMAEHIYAKQDAFSGTDAERAEDLMRFYRDDSVDAIYAKTGRESVLYQVKNMVYAKGELQQKRFADYLSGKSNDLFDLNYEFLQGTYLEGIVVGGNIRCLLKLAGTEFWPDMTGKILLLESYGGETGGIATAMNQLDLMGVFDQVAGVLLGTFSKYEEAALSLGVFDLLKMHISDTLPVVKTTEIGHSPDSKAIVIGRNMKLKKGDLWQIH